MNSTHKLCCLALLLAVFNATYAAADDALLEKEPIDFNREIRPILADHCLFCHGLDEESREADLRLDRFDDAVSSGAIVPENPNESELLRRILSDDPDEVMPPPETDKPVSPSDRELLRRWIEQGAVYEEHWSWRALQRPPLPSTRLNDDAPVALDSTGNRSAIDAFLQANWLKQDITPAAPASPRERLRRLSFDLRGLPPSPKDVRAFESDPSDQHFFRFRDRWMGELAFAEHQAVAWLDLVRWADTSGFVSDEPIASGAYRAWIIRAIADNMPFDEFSIAQLAGDLLEDPSDDQLVASGYNRIVNTNCEAGAIEAEQLYKLKGEHVRALGTVWLGLTTGCAECHDHKFDPFSARDYYSLAAFFDDLVEAGVYTPGDRRQPLHHVHKLDKDRLTDRQLSSRIADLMHTIGASDLGQIRTWETEVRSALKNVDSRADFLWAPTQLPAAHRREGGYHTVQLDGRPARQTKAGPGELSRHHAAELMTGYLSPGSLKTDKEKDAWFVDVWIDPDDRPELIGFQVSNGRYGRLGWQSASYETYYWSDEDSAKLANEIPLGEQRRVKRIDQLPSNSGWIRLRVPLENTIKPVGGKSFEAVGMAWLHRGGRVGWGDSGLELRRDKVTRLELGETAIRKWWERPLNRQTFERRMNFVVDALRKDVSDRTDLEKQIVQDAYREHLQPERFSELRRLESSLSELRADALKVLVSRSAPVRKTTRLLHRGDYQDDSGPELRPALPARLTPTPSPGQEERLLSRLDLARWLFAADNPVPARVFVNRLWHQFYGRGLSETLEDSGTQGDAPSHPELLDWLACEFRESGWDRNHLIRLLTSAKAYQLSSTPSAEMIERDPGNRWHARQGRSRLTAETIRDTTLVAAGLLNEHDKVPTNSFFPYQPSEYWTRSDKVMFGSRHMIWETSADREQYQRSVYTFWKRQNVHPTLLAFDAPTRQECTAKRNVTNTPGQALALLNDPMFVEAARVLGEKLHEKSSDGEAQAIRWAFRRTLQRDPEPQERRIIGQLLSNARDRYAQAPTQATALLNVGQSPVALQESAHEVAAWTVVARTLLNLHEFLNRP